MSAPPRIIPLFPLPVAVLPGEIVPLNIVEDRYRDMISECRRLQDAGGEGCFGILLVHENSMFTAGCTVTIRETTAEHADGRLDIVTVGGRRFRVVQIFRDKPYLSAAVEYYDDATDGIDAGLRQRVVRLFAELTQKAGVDASLQWIDQEARLSYRLASALVADQLPKQHLLELTDENTRLEFVAEVISAILLGLEQPDDLAGPPPAAQPGLFLGDQ